jgi:hypothetical protein
MKLHRYWFRFDMDFRGPHPPGALLGCGVTALDHEDARQLVRHRVFKSEPLPPVVSLIEDVEVSRLDAGHVLPYLGDCSRRGVWFPLGYE